MKGGENKMIHITKKITTVFSVAAVFAMTAMPTLASHNDSEAYRANLRTLNSSDVRGRANMTLEGDQLKVTINARGYEANKLHVQHIHGFANKQNSVCPSPSADINNDGVVDLVEGLPSYGPILLNFEPFPTADSKGSVNFQNTYTVNVSDLGPLENRAIVLHGATVNGNYDPTLPVACGQIVMTHKGNDNGNENGGNGNEGANGGGSEISIKSNGSNSNNSIDVRSSNDTRVSQNNDTRIDNNVDAASSTGNNRANGNTGGDSSVRSGNSFQSIRIKNLAGHNMLSH